MKYLFIISFSLSFFYSQGQTAFEIELEAIASKVATKIKSKSKKKVAVWYFTDTRGRSSDIGRYIAEDFSVYFTNSGDDLYSVLDRNHLEQIMEEHKLNSEGYIDSETAKKLGYLNAADAVITGTVDVLKTTLKVRIKVIDTETSLQIAAEMNFLPMDENICSFLGKRCDQLNKKTETPVEPEKFKIHYRDLNTNESYDHSANVNPNCIKRKTGDYCFKNNTKTDFEIHYGPRREELVVTIKPKETFCFNDQPIENKPFYVSYEKFRNYNSSSGRMTKYIEAFAKPVQCTAVVYNISGKPPGARKSAFERGLQEILKFNN